MAAGPDLAAAAAVAGAVGADGGAVGWQPLVLLALPDAMLSEVMGNLGVKCLGRASCACRCLRDTVTDERLWTALWEGPLPDGFPSGGKAAHAALWLLARGEVEQTRIVVCEPASPTRTASRRRIGDAGLAAAAFSGSTTAASAGRVRGGGAGLALGGGGGGAAAAVAGVAAAAAGFPVHVSCMAISGGVIATAAGPEISVWDLEAAAPRARFNVSGHGSVTCLLLRHGTLLAGDNSGYLRSYDVSAAGGRPLHEIRTHTDRVTAMDAFTLVPDGITGTGDPDPYRIGGGGGGGTQVGNTSSRAHPNRAAVSTGDGGGGGGGGAGQQKQWDQGHGWGEGWTEGEREEEQRAAPPTAAAPLAPLAPPPQGGGGNSSISSHHGSGASPSSSNAAASPSAPGGNAAGGGRGRGGGGRGHGSILGGLGEPLLRLGKRQGYAGRGQGDEPWDSAAAAVGTLMQQQRWQGGADYGRSSSGAAGGWGEEDQKEDDGDGEDGGGGGQQPRSGAGNRGRARGKCAGARGGGGGGENRTALLFTGSDDGTAKAWDAESGRFVCVYAGHTRGLTCLQAALTESYGPVLVTGGGDSAVIIWELATGRCLEKLETGAGLVTNPGGAGPRVGCLQAYRNSIVVGEDRHVSVWSLSKGQRPRLARASFCEHQRPIRRLELMGRWIVTCSGDYVIRLWDSKTGGCIRELGTKTGAAITSFRLSGLCLLSTSLFDASVLMTSFLPRRKEVQ